MKNPMCVRTPRDDRQRGKRHFTRFWEQTTGTKMPTSADPFFSVAVHEAGHAVACMLAHRALGRDWPSLYRLLVRRDFASPYIDDRNREIKCRGLLEGPADYTA